MVGIHYLFMAHFSIPHDDSKKGEERRHEVPTVLPIMLAMPVPHVSDWYKVLAEQAALVLTSQTNIIIDFGIPGDIQHRFKGYMNPEYSYNKNMEQIKKEGGIKKGVWIEPDTPLITCLLGVMSLALM